MLHCDDWSCFKSYPEDFFFWGGDKPIFSRDRGGLVGQLIYWCKPLPKKNAVSNSRIPCVQTSKTSLRYFINFIYICLLWCTHYTCISKTICNVRFISLYHVSVNYGWDLYDNITHDMCLLYMKIDLLNFFFSKQGSLVLLVIVFAIFSSS